MRKFRSIILVLVIVSLLLPGCRSKPRPAEPAPPQISEFVSILLNSFEEGEVELIDKRVRWDGEGADGAVEFIEYSTDFDTHGNRGLAVGVNLPEEEGEGVTNHTIGNVWGDPNFYDNETVLAATNYKYVSLDYLWEPDEGSTGDLEMSVKLNGWSNALGDNGEWDGTPQTAVAGEPATMVFTLEGNDTEALDCQIGRFWIQIDQNGGNIEGTLYLDNIRLYSPHLNSFEEGEVELIDKRVKWDGEDADGAVEFEYSSEFVTHGERSLAVTVNIPEDGTDHIIGNIWGDPTFYENEPLLAAKTFTGIALDYYWEPSGGSTGNLEMSVELDGWSNALKANANWLGVSQTPVVADEQATMVFTLEEDDIETLDCQIARFIIHIDKDGGNVEGTLYLDNIRFED